MHPELFTLPGVGVTIKTYGFCLMVGFLSAVWLAMRRAERLKGDPDILLDMAFLCLLFGVLGARVFYVVHYWSPQFADAPNKFLAVVDITKGGLEFLGGFLGAAVSLIGYAVYKKVSIRLYLDFLAPALMWGLAFGRLGCFFNGCCFGSECTVPQTDRAVHAWAVEFPFSSAAQWREWEDRRVTVPAELVVTLKKSPRLQPWLLSGSLINMPVEKLAGANRLLADAREAYERAKASAVDDADVARLKAAFEAAAKAKHAHDLEIAELLRAQYFPSRVVPTRHTSVTELQEIAAQFRSLPVHPTQLYSSINAMILSLLLWSLLQVRKRHGVVVATLLVLYPIARVILEQIRVDNPHDVAGFTVSQFVSVFVFATGIVSLIVLYKFLPERSPMLENVSANDEPPA